VNKKEEHFFSRFSMHVRSVQDYCCKLAPSVDFGNQLVANSFRHDLSKAVDSELFSAYVDLAWINKLKKCGEEVSVELSVLNRITEAGFKHISSEMHHPEFWIDAGPKEKIEILKHNKKNDALICCYMPNLYLAEMVCDWCAVSSEIGNSPIDWAHENIGKRWAFSKEQAEFIFECLNFLWR
jgi:hypothetical protein